MNFPNNLWLLPLAFAFPALSSAASLHTLVSDGPSSNRVDIVFLSEGYTSTQSSKFLTDATNAFNNLLSQEPFAAYKGSFNAFAIWVASAQSGSDHFGVTRNTYFNSSYDSFSDFIITLDNVGQARVDELLAALKPDADLSIVLVNDVTPGGSDGFGKTAIASVNVNSKDILAHEVGHVLAGLGDEYDMAYPGFPDVEEPNTTRETNREQIKWKAWISPETPIPTPESFDYEQVIGLFEGAHYHESGWYRPKFDCKMNHPPVPFCEVCSEQLVLSVLRKARPITSSSPSGTQVTLGAGSSVEFALGLLRPNPDTLQVQWYTNGAAIPGATNASLSLSAGDFSGGSNYLSAVVFDSTPLVRKDIEDLRRQTVSWTVNTTATAELRFEDARLLDVNLVAFRLAGPAGETVVIQTSTNLQHWSNAATNTLVSGSLSFTSSLPSTVSRAFFRAVRMPRGSH